MTVLDLFSGAGGMTQGFHMAGGYVTVAAVEADPVAAASFEATFGEGIVHVARVDEWLERNEVPHVDVVIGGPPCQGFSTLGRQDVEDGRNRLWEDYATTIVRARPRYFVLENVGAFLRAPQFAALCEATGRTGPLADYDIQAAVINAADYGAAQARRRTIVIGHHRDLLAPGMPAATHVGAPVPLRSALKGVRRAVTRTELPSRSMGVRDRLQPGPFFTKELHIGRTYSSVSMARIRSIPDGGNRYDIPDRLQPPCWRKHRSGSADVMGRLRWDRPWSSPGAWCLSRAA